MSRDKVAAAAHRRFWQLFFQRDLHIRVPDRGDPHVYVRLVGHARDLHGPDGCCTCCPRRPV